MDIFFEITQNNIEVLKLPTLPCDYINKTFMQ